MLEDVVQELGGWEAAVFLDSGVVNLDVDVAAWPVEDQVFIRMHQCSFAVETLILMVSKILP